jgi:hypothetical protein
MSKLNDTITDWCLVTLLLVTILLGAGIVFGMWQELLVNKGC